MFLSCEHCYKHDLVCLVNSSARLLKCANCAKRGIKCVDVSWESLDRTQKQTREEIDSDLDGMDKSLNEIEKIQTILRSGEFGLPGIARLYRRLRIEQRRRPVVCLPSWRNKREGERRTTDSRTVNLPRPLLTSLVSSM
jgi:hypothetical protein